MTVESLRNLIEGAIEPAEPAASILAYLKEHDGKQLTKRDEPKLQKIDGTIRIRKQYGMTQIEWGGTNGGSLTIAWTEAAPTIDAKLVEEKNTAYFSAREERNAARAKALQSPELLERCSKALNAKLAAEAELAQLFSYGEPLYTDEFKIREMWSVVSKVLGCWPRIQK